MRLIDFTKRYPNEEACKQAFKLQRERVGIKCKKCSGTSHYWISTREQYQCKQCSFRTTLRSGTLLENTKLSYYDWFLALHLLTSTKKGFSAKEIQRQMNKAYYEPVWRMLHKIRAIMGTRDEEYKLSGLVEMDDAHFEVAYPADLGTKPGMGSEAKQKVLVMASSEEVISQKKNKKLTRCKYFKMRTVDYITQAMVGQVIDENVQSSSRVVTDGSNSFNHVGLHVKEHHASVLKASEVSKVLPWVHTSISNCKRTLLSVHHCVDRKYLQNYLDEFCYKLNRRYHYENAFEKLLKISTLYRNQLIV